MVDSPPHRLLVVGAGSIGRRHARYLVERGDCRVALCDPADDARAGWSGPVFDDDAVALAEFRPDAVWICTPPAAHLGPACRALRHGADLYLEKPVSHDLAGLDELTALAAETARIIQIGYQLPFDVGFVRLRRLLALERIGPLRWARFEFGQHLAAWRPDRDYRTTYSAQRAAGGGVLLDASHDLHACATLLGWPEHVAGVVTCSGGLDADIEDCAALVLTCGATVVEVHLDCLRPEYRRVYEFVGERGALRWDEGRRELHMHVDGQATRWACPGTYHDAYTAAAEHFLACVRTRRPPRVGLDDGIRTMHLVDRIAAATTRTVTAREVV